jgi:hypothetical protein
MTLTPEQRVVPAEGADDELGAAPPAAAPPPAAPDPAADPDPEEPATADQSAEPDPPVRAAPAVSLSLSAEPTGLAPQPVPADACGFGTADQPEQMMPQQTAPPEQPAAHVPGGSTMARGTSRGPRDVPRWARWTVLPLLVLVPAGYLAVSADQSRDSGETIQEQAAARELTMVSPTPLQKRVYQVPMPLGARHVAFLETNSWDTSVLDVQFTTTPGGLDTFLAKVGTSRAALLGGWDAISPAQAKGTGWTFPATRTWAGIRLQQAGDKPDHAIMVDLTDDDAPRVYVVSTVNFQHGFGGG